MEKRLKERLFGAFVLVAVTVIFLPMLFDDPHLIIETPTLSGKQIPPAPPPLDSTLSFEPPAELKSVPPEPESTELAKASQSEPDAVESMEEEGEPTVAEIEKSSAPVPPTIAATPKPAASPVTPAPTVSAKIEKPASTKPAKTPAATTLAREIPTLEKPAAYAVQLGIFSKQDNADLLIQRLRAKGFDAYSRTAFGDDTKIRVLVGPRIDRKKAETLRDQIATEFSIEGFVIPYQPIEG